MDNLIKELKNFRFNVIDGGSDVSLKWIRQSLDEIIKRHEASAPVAQPVQQAQDAPILVAWLEADPRAKYASLKDVVCSAMYSTRWHWTPIKPEVINNVLFPIYTTP